MARTKLKTMACECGNVVQVNDATVGVKCNKCLMKGFTMTPEQEERYMQQVEEAKNKPRRKVRGVGNFARELLRSNMEIDGEEAVKLVKAEYPDSKFDLSHYKYYLSKVKKEIREAIFEAPKLYAMTTEEGTELIAAKGFSKVADPEAEGGQRKLNYQDFCRLLEHREVPIAQFSRIRGNLKAGRYDPHDLVVEKRYLGKVRPKRRELPDGSTEPWTVEQLK